jgi:chromate reductase
MENGGVRLLAVAGSIREGNFTSKALTLVLDELKLHRNVSVDRIDLRTTQLSPPGMPFSEDAKRLQQTVLQATGLILATPEYHGSYSSVIKLFIENLGFPSTLARKPVALLGVAAGQIGAIKALEHLRSVCSHIGAIVLPGVVSVAGVQQLFDEQGRCLDEATEKRIRGVATNLLDYIHENICPRVALEEMARRGSADWMKRYAASL